MAKDVLGRDLGLDEKGDEVKLSGAQLAEIQERERTVHDRVKDLIAQANTMLQNGAAMNVSFVNELEALLAPQ